MALGDFSAPPQVAASGTRRPAGGVGVGGVSAGRARGSPKLWRKQMKSLGMVTNCLVCGLLVVLTEAAFDFQCWFGVRFDGNHKNEGGVVALVSTFRSVFQSFTRAFMVAFVRHVVFGHRSSKDARILGLHFHSQRPRIFYPYLCIYV